MKLPNWFRIIWWGLLLIVVSLHLFKRYPEFILGKSAPVDVIVFLVWIALWLLPIVSELNLFGIKLKKEVEAIHKDLSNRIDTLRNELHNTIDIRSEVNPQFTLQMPAPDAQLPRIGEQVRSAVQNAMDQYGIQRTTVQPEIAVSETENYLFGVRHNIERELRRIYTQRFPDDNRRRYTSVIAISRALTNYEVLNPDLANAIREVYRACSAAIHGEEVTEAQVGFIRDVAPVLLSTLRAIA